MKKFVIPAVVTAVIGAAATILAAIRRKNPINTHNKEGEALL